MPDAIATAGPALAQPGPSGVAVDGPATAPRPLLGLRPLTVLFMAVSMALALYQLPLDLDFQSFTTLDQGANLKVQVLLDQGMIPTVDFGYPYGLLPLLVGRPWFAALGRTPQAYAAAMLVVDLLIAWGLARAAHALRAGPAGIALILCGMINATLGSYINLVHAFEAVLICHALAEHADGRRPRALALLTACLFMKPVMAYLYGLLLVLLILRSVGIRGLVRAAIPAALIGIVLLAALTARFGPGPAIHSLLPSQGAESYRLANYGFFFGSGRNFWLPDGVRPRHFLFTPAGHYLAGSIVLAVAAAASAWRLARGLAAKDDFNAEVIACCGIMHVTFVTMFYGDRMSYTYYYYILIIGLVAVAARGPRRALLIALIAAAALAGNKDGVNWVKSRWREARPTAETFGLWADADTREEWRHVRQIIGERTVPFLCDNGGCLEMYMPGSGDLAELFLCNGYPTPVELRRKLRQIAASDFVITIAAEKGPRPAIRAHRAAMTDRWPELGEELKGFEPVWSGRIFQVNRRRPPSPTIADPAQKEGPGAEGQGRRPIVGGERDPASPQSWSRSPGASSQGGARRPESPSSSPPAPGP